MKKVIVKITTCCLVGTMLATGFSINIDASSLSSVLPVAGIARALNEGKSVTAVKADKIKITASGNQLTALTSLGSGQAIETFSALDNEETTIKETTYNSDPAIITVGAASIATSSEETTVSENDSSEVSSNGAEESDEVSESDLVDVTTTDEEETKEEDFTNLVIAQVNDYVNVRDQASEDGEIVGKLYNNSVGDLLETEGDWIKIKSGNTEGYVKGEYVVTGEEAEELAKEVGVRTAVVTCTTLFVRSEPSVDASVLGMVPIEDELTVIEESDDWVKVSIEEGDGYVSKEYVSLYTDFVRAESKQEEEARLEKEEAARKAAQESADKAIAKKSSKTSSGASAAVVSGGSGTGGSVANYALQFVGNPYVYGGTSLTNGTDCSGFVMSVYRNYGVSLPHSSGGDRGVGYDVGGIQNAQPGDIVCYSGHVAIYIGGGQIVHASTQATGIKVSNATYKNIVAVRRIF